MIEGVQASGNPLRAEGAIDSSRPGCMRVISREGRGLGDECAVGGRGIIGGVIEGWTVYGGMVWRGSG